MVVAARRGEQIKLAAQLCQFSAGSVGQIAGDHLHSGAANANKIIQQFAQFGAGKLVFVRVGEHGAAASIGDPLDHCG